MRGPKPEASFWRNSECNRGLARGFKVFHFGHALQKVQGSELEGLMLVPFKQLIPKSVLVQHLGKWLYFLSWRRLAVEKESAVVLLAEPHVLAKVFLGQGLPGALES